MQKLKDRLDVGVWIADGSITYGACENPDGGSFFLSEHEGEMPAHRTREFKTFDELVIAMKKIAPLKYWRNREIV